MFFLRFFLILPQISDIMVNLPADFVAETRRIMGDERYNRFVGAFDEEAPTSIRVNPRIAIDHGPLTMDHSDSQVPWCSEGYYLNNRPQFTFDPLLHAGCYYVQEASSMFVTHILRNVQCSAPALLACKARMFNVQRWFTSPAVSIRPWDSRRAAARFTTWWMR